MKKQMNLTRICWALSSFLTCLLSTPQTRGQTLNERQMGAGYEPVINCDRRLTSDDTTDKRIQFVWTGPDSSSTTIYWAISHDLGQNWGSACQFSNGLQEVRLDPFAACDIWSSDPTRRMYFGWFQQVGGTTGDYFRRSLSGGANCDMDVDNSALMQDSQTYGFPDRPWLAANNASLYLSFAGGQSTPWGYVKQAIIPAGSDPVNWSDPAHPAHLVFTPVSTTTTTLASNFPVAGHRDSAGNERVFLMTRQYVTTGCLGVNPGDINAIRIKRTLDQWIHWVEETINVDGADGFPVNRDLRMTTDHITRDPSTSAKQAYAFYVRNEATAYPAGGGQTQCPLLQGQR